MAATIDGKVRVALIGTGGISGAHGNGYKKFSQKIGVAALCDLSEPAMERRSQQLGGVDRRYTDWKAMLKEMGGEIDAVDICLPHHLHAPAILDAVAAGKHVLCEKPMCITRAEADAIAAAVAEAGVTYMSGHNQLFMPAVAEAKRIIVAGELGAIHWLRSQDCFRAGGFGTSWRSKLATQGGGELIDTGYHPSYRLLHLAGSKAVAIRGTMGRFMQAIEGEDTACVQVRFENGTIGEVHTSWAYNPPYGTHHIHVMGEKGQIFGTDNTLYYLPNGYSEPASRSFPAVDTFEAEIGHFADCLRQGNRPIHGVEEGRAVLELILGAAESAQGWQATAPVQV